MKLRGDFLGPPRSTDKTTLIIKVSKGAKIRNRYKKNSSPGANSIHYEMLKQLPERNRFMLLKLIIKS